MPLDDRDVHALAQTIEERLAPARLTAREMSEAICIALGVPPALSAAAARVSLDTVRARRRRIRRKLEAVRRTGDRITR